MAIISFFVPDEIAAQMTRKSVYLDVFGNVRWTEDTAFVVGSSQWEVDA